MELRDLLRREIERRGVSQAQAAREMGVSQPVLSRWLADAEQLPSTENCQRVAVFLGQPVIKVLQMAGRVAASNQSDDDMEWDVFQRDVREVFGPDPSLWEAVLYIAKAAKAGLDRELLDFTKKSERDRNLQAIAQVA